MLTSDSLTSLKPVALALLKTPSQSSTTNSSKGATHDSSTDKSGSSGSCSSESESEASIVNNADIVLEAILHICTIEFNRRNI